MNKLIISYSINPETKEHLAILAGAHNRSASSELDEIVAVEWRRYQALQVEQPQTEDETPGLLTICG